MRGVGGYVTTVNACIHVYVQYKQHAKFIFDNYMYMLKYSVYYKLNWLYNL